MVTGTAPFGAVTVASKLRTMAKWSDSDIYKKTRGTNRWTRFVGWLNNLLNPDHAWVSDWNEYSENTSPSEDIINQITKQDLTGAEKAANQFTASEAEKQRQWEADMQNTAYQRQVADMQKAGINPALAMSNGQPSTPSGAAAQSVSPSTSGMSMSDLMQLMVLPAQKRLIEAQANATNVGAKKSEAEIGEIEGRTAQLRLINKYYPSLTETQIDKLKKDLGLTDEQIKSERLRQSVLESDKIIKSAEADNASELYKWKVEYEKASTQKAKDDAAASAARAAWDIFEKNWTQKHNGARPSSSGVLAIAAAVSEFLGITDSDGEGEGETHVVGDAIRDKAQEIKDLMDDPAGTIDKKGKEIDDKLNGFRSRGKKFLQNAYNRSRTKYGLK